MPAVREPALPCPVQVPRAPRARESLRRLCGFPLSALKQESAMSAQALWSLRLKVETEVRNVFASSLAGASSSSAAAHAAALRARVRGERKAFRGTRPGLLSSCAKRPCVMTDTVLPWLNQHTYKILGVQLHGTCGPPALQPFGERRGPPRRVGGGGTCGQGIIVYDSTLII